MTSKECITATLEGRKKSKLGHFDIFSDSILKKWKKKKLNREFYPEEKFDLDIFLFGYKSSRYKSEKEGNDLEQIFPIPDVDNLESCDYGNYSLESKVYKRALLNNKYICVAFPGPFQHLCSLMGYQWVLDNLILQKDLIKRLYKESVNYNLQMLKIIYDKGYKFDGIWIWEDIAYEKGLFFSLSYYEELLSEFHRTLIHRVSDLNKRVFFHSDGNIKEVLPKLVDYGIEAVHPLESDIFCIKEIRKKFPGLVCMGNMDYSNLSSKDSFIEKMKLKDRYIFGADSAISDEISLAEYENLIKSKDLLWE